MSDQTDQTVDRAPDAPLDKVEWRVQGKIDRGDGVQVVAYLDAPTVSALLDQWVGPARWRDHYEPTGKAGTMWCHLSVRFDDEWVTKEDLGTASDMEADKGLVSDAFKRVAMRKWGVGRNVFDLPVLRITSFRKVERQGKDPQAYLDGTSAREIRAKLKQLGFDDAAEATKVVGADETPSEPEGQAPHDTGEAQPSVTPPPAQAPAGASEAQLAALDEVIAEAEAAGVTGDFDATRAWAAESAANVEAAVRKIRAAIEKAKPAEVPA